MIKHQEIAFIDWIKSFFKPQHIINKGDIGIYTYIWTCDTFYNNSDSIQYHLFAKLKVLECYNDVVEVELLDLKINGSANVEIINIIKNNFPKYIKQTHINWALKQN